MAAGSALIVLTAGLQLALAYPTFRAQERYLKERFGADYEKYARRVPRYLFWRSATTAPSGFRVSE